MVLSLRLCVLMFRNECVLCIGLCMQRSSIIFARCVGKARGDNEQENTVHYLSRASCCRGIKNECTYISLDKYLPTQCVSSDVSQSIRQSVSNLKEPVTVMSVARSVSCSHSLQTLLPLLNCTMGVE